MGSVANDDGTELDIDEDIPITSAPTPAAAAAAGRGGRGAASKTGAVLGLQLGALVHPLSLALQEAAPSSCQYNSTAWGTEGSSSLHKGRFEVCVDMVMCCTPMHVPAVRLSLELTHSPFSLMDKQYSIFCIRFRNTLQARMRPRRVAGEAAAADRRRWGKRSHVAAQQRRGRPCRRARRGRAL